MQMGLTGENVPDAVYAQSRVTQKRVISRGNPCQQKWYWMQWNETEAFMSEREAALHSAAESRCARWIF